jgi:hypothetical protein
VRPGSGGHLTRLGKPNRHVVEAKVEVLRCGARCRSLTGGVALAFNENALGWPTHIPAAERTVKRHFMLCQIVMVVLEPAPHIGNLAAAAPLTRKQFELDVVGVAEHSH